MKKEKNLLLYVSSNMSSILRLKQNDCLYFFKKLFMKSSILSLSSIELLPIYSTHSSV